MHIKTVTLKNWRSYSRAEFRFPAPRPQKKVILVGAMNGHGKTSLLMALHLGLFGREAVRFLEGYRIDGDTVGAGYKSLLSKIIHRPALETDDPQMFVELEFVAANGDEVTVTRTWNFRRGGQVRDLEDGEGEEVRLSVNGRLERFPGWKEANALIATRLFPLHVMPCFFFDGEQAQQRVEAAGGSAMSDAIRALYGTSLVDELDEGLASFIGNERTQLKTDLGEVENSELETLRNEAAKLDRQIKDARKKKENLATEIEEARKRKEAKLLELQQLGADASIDIAQLAKRHSDLKQQQQDLDRRLTEGLAGVALPLALRRRMEAVRQQLQAEVIRDRWQVLKEETMPKVERIITDTLSNSVPPEIHPPLTGDQTHGLEQRMRTALETLWSPPPTGCAESYRFPFLGQSDRSALINRLTSSGLVGVTDIASIAAERQAFTLRVKEAKRQLESSSDFKPRTEQLRREYSEADESFLKLTGEKASLETVERGDTDRLKNLTTSLRQMEERQDKRGPVERRLEVAERIRDVIRDTREQLVPLCRTAIAKACTAHFTEMISDEYRHFEVDFDDEQQPFLRGPGGETVPVGGMSGAQKRAFGLAFTLAIAEASGEESPIVIDTPVGNMDGEYRMRVLRHLAKRAPGQLIFLSHDEEISREYARELDTYVAEKYLVSFTQIGEGAGRSVPRQGSYFTR